MHTLGKYICYISELWTTFVSHSQLLSSIEMEEINQNNLLRFMNNLEQDKSKIDYSKYQGWNDWHPEFEHEFVRIGQIEQEPTWDTPSQYWGTDAPILLNKYPYCTCEIHQCPVSNQVFFHYVEFGGHAPQKRYRLINKDLIDIESIKPTLTAEILSKPYKYAVYKNPDLTFELSICKPVALGIDIYHIMTENEIRSFIKNGIATLESRIKDMDENYSDYRVVSWR